MKHGNKNIIAVLILAVGLIVSALIYAHTERYKVITNNGYVIVYDSWTNKGESMKHGYASDH